MEDEVVKVVRVDVVLELGVSELDDKASEVKIVVVGVNCVDDEKLDTDDESDVELSRDDVEKLVDVVETGSVVDVVASSVVDVVA